METIQQQDVAEIKAYLKRIAEAVEVMARKTDSNFNPGLKELLRNPAARDPQSKKPGE